MRGAVPNPGFGLLFIGVTLAAGCSFDTAPSRSSGNGLQTADVPAAATAGDGDRFPGEPTGSDTGAPAMDPQPAEGPLPELTYDAGSGAMDEPMDPEPMDPEPMDPTQPPEPAQPALPVQGGVLDRCTLDSGCTGELVCVPGEPGFCSAPCQDEGECDTQGGYATSCFDEVQACRIECEEDGDCPQGFGCESAGRGNGRLCLPEPEEGAGDRGPLEPCDIKRGDSDCFPGLVCYRWNDTQVDGPGYCTAPCSSSGDCQAMVAAGAQLGCGSEGACRFNCTNAPCPAFMECEEIAGMGGRCKYPADTPY